MAGAGVRTIGGMQCHHWLAPLARPLASITTALLLAGTPPMARAIEEPAYTVVTPHESFEVREYAPFIVAELAVPGPAEDAGNKGFRLLAAYIFGANQGERKIAMTAPVSQAPAPAKIEMTAPVSQTEAAGGFRVQFTMPASFTMDTLPLPLDPQVKLRQLPARRYAVIRYSGFWSQANYDQHLQQLRQAVAAAGLQTTGEPRYARYDAPWVPWFMRRNEIWLPLP
jgi:hypothetical protein